MDGGEDYAVKDVTLALVAAAFLAREHLNDCFAKNQHRLIFFSQFLAAPIKKAPHLRL